MVKSSLLSLVGAFVFLLTVVCVNAGVVPGAFEVPHETNDGNVKNLPLVRIGVSEDGLLRVSPEFTPPMFPPRLKLGNHQRTLRAFLWSDDQNGSIHLLVEQARPHQFFEVSGAFTPANTPGALYWEDETRLRFLGVSSAGVPSSYVVDLRKGTFVAFSLVGDGLVGEYSEL